MKNGKYGKELELLLLLTENTDYTVANLAEKLNISGRLVYYYLDYLHMSGFKIVKKGRFYRLDLTSPFFSRLHESIALNRDEAAYMHRVLNERNVMSTLSLNVRRKLERYYNLDNEEYTSKQQLISSNLHTLNVAIASHKLVKLCKYSSPHSKTISDRTVEPFQIFNDGCDLRCYEPSSKMNKTFRLSRMESVEILDVPWFNEEQHKSMYTDLFLFSGETYSTVELMLGQLSYNLLMEEYPQAACNVAQREEKRWYFCANVVSYLGIGRFVLGLYDDIDVIGDEGFKLYINEKIEKMKKHKL